MVDEESVRAVMAIHEKLDEKKKKKHDKPYSLPVVGE